jgi:hypothetical protein
MTESEKQAELGRRIGRGAFFGLRAMIIVAGVVGLSMWLHLPIWPGLAILYIISEAQRHD